MKIDAILMKKYQGLVKVLGLKNGKVQGRFFAKNTEVLQRVNQITAKNDKVQTRVKAIIPIVLVSLLATCSTSPSYASEPKPLISHGGYSSQLGKTYLIATHYQLSKLNSFILIDTVAVSGNNGCQERKKLLTTVEHRTIADVFLCLSFASLPVMGELRLALAITPLWWGGGGNKPFIRRILPAVLLRFLTLPAALNLGQIIKTRKKGLTK
jgi:hypothetical protein